MSKNDGGPAFPLQYDPFVDHPTHGRIHRAALGEDVQVGMSLRDYFAGQALKSLIAKAIFIDREGVNGEQMTQGDINQFRADIAESAYFYADAMLAEREKKNEA